MEAAAAVKSYQRWSGKERALPLAKKLIHSPTLHLSCRFQAPSAPAPLNWCKEQRPKNGWFPMWTRKRSNRECQSALIDTFSFTRTTTTSTTYNDTEIDFPPPFFTKQQEDDEVGVQELTVYEVNELDRGSPMLLFSSKLTVDWYKRLQNLRNLFNLGDFVPFTNKIFDGSLKKRLGITAGIISAIQYYPKEDGYLFDAIYSFYFGDFGHISVKGPYKSHEDTILTVTGGSGIFTGVFGTVKIHNVEYPLVLFYTFKLHGIPQLPQALRWKTIPPTKGLRPSSNASLPGVALPNFTD